MGGADHCAEPADECGYGGQLADEQVIELLVDGHRCGHGWSGPQGTDSSGSRQWLVLLGVTFRECTR
jgi:hypothetical protein